MSKEESIPLYNGGSVFLGDLRQFLLGPMVAPQRMHSTLNPHYHMFAVYARQGMQHARAVEAFCKEHSSHFQVIRERVEFGKTTISVDLIQTYFENCRQNPPPLNIQNVVIIENADILVMDPDSEITSAFMLDLEREALQAGCIIVACFNRLPLGGTRNHQLPERTRLFREQVVSKFAIRFFVPSPPPSYRKALLQHLFREGVDFLRTQGVSCSVELSEENYANLETLSSFCTPTDLLHFAQRVLMDIAYEGREKNGFAQQRADGKDTFAITFDVLSDSYMSSRDGVKHILSSIHPRYEENELSTYCGKGPIAGMAPPLPKRKTQEEGEGVLKRGRAQLEEQEDEGSKKVKEDEEEKQKVLDAFSEIKGE